MRVLKEGTRLAQRYTLIRRLGAGGMAETWLANDSQADSKVALKFLAAPFTDNKSYRDLMHREWRIGSNLMHANIVRVFEFQDDPDGAFYSLQFVGDADLGRLCGERPEYALPPLGLIADALRYAHAKGVVHRDIKASNVLLDANGVPHLVDFGVAAMPGESVGGGSEVNASPQQSTGEAPQPADDIYALGVLMHELLAGLPPTSPAPVSITLADGTAAPPAIDALVSDMLANDAAMRPKAEQVAARLAAAGFPPGPAPGLDPGDLRITPQQVAESIRPQRRELRPAIGWAAAQQAASGISSRTLYGSLAAALVVLFGVVFLLPAIVEQQEGDAPAVSVSGEPAGVSGEEAIVDDSGPAAAPAGAGFNENLRAEPRSGAASVKVTTDDALGELLSKLGRLKLRAIERWGGQAYLDAVDKYAQGDEAYLAKNYALAGERYREASHRLDPLFDRIDEVFQETLSAARQAFDVPDPTEAVRLYDLAVAITPGHPEAEAGLKRALNLQSVLDLTAQGIRFEKDLEFAAAKLAFEKALELDALWEPAAEGLERMRVAIRQMNFDMRMSEGLEALAAGEFATARAAFNAAKLLDPASTQPADGLLQVDQGIRLANIRRLEREADVLVADEQWEASITVYEEILGIDPDLTFAKDGLKNSRSRAALHNKLQGFIDDPDTLSDPVNMQMATRLLLDVARISPIGPRLDDQKNELSRLLKRAATPLKVQLISDNATDVAIYKVGHIGTFSRRDLELVPGVYVAVGIKLGFRDVRLEFRVAPEIEMKPIVIQCEERI